MTATSTGEPLLDDVLLDDLCDPAPTPDSSDQHDRMALVWDLRVHMLEREFATYVAGLVGDDARPVDQARAAVRIAATRWALGEIEEALDRVASGTFGSCRRCAKAIDQQTLRRVPLTTLCPACHRP